VRVTANDTCSDSAPRFTRGVEIWSGGDAHGSWELAVRQGDEGSNRFAQTLGSRDSRVRRMAGGLDVWSVAQGMQVSGVRWFPMR
jgi:hypothetical protein